MTKEQEFRKQIEEAKFEAFSVMCEKVAELEKENAELKNQVSFLEDNLRVARKDRENLQLDVAKGLKGFVKDYPATSLRYLANEKYVELFTKAKGVIEKLLNAFASNDFFEEEELSAMEQAEQFLNEVEK